LPLPLFPSASLCLCVQSRAAPDGPPRVLISRPGVDELLRQIDAQRLFIDQLLLLIDQQLLWIDQLLLFIDEQRL